jgi:choline dehydrogenase
VTYIDKNRERVSTETAYLTTDVLERPNLKVAIHAQVTQILFEKVDGKLRAVGVEFANAKNGPRFRARARKQVILACVIDTVSHRIFSLFLLLPEVAPFIHLM